MAENRFLGSISASSFRNLLPKSVSSSQKMNTNRRKSKFNSENVPPPDPNIQISDPPLSASVSFPKKSTTFTQNQVVPKSDVEQVPIPPPSDPPVKVVVRIRPASGGDRTVRKVINDSISVGDKGFTFDSVFDLNSTQDDVFQLVGVPLVKDALSGYNTSVLAYGQTGSGKTYTMWGPPSAIVENLSADSSQGIVPRIFQMLFSEIQREQHNSKGKQINYQCRCSFLEIYNDQIGDLLDPTQRDLEIKDDVKNGFYVENLTEEYVTSYDEVAQILIKGLSSRKVGATSNNSKSSRSHIVFTCILESWCKETSSKCFGSSKSCRISLIDLAGFDKNVMDDDKQCAKEGKFVKKSTSQLGRLVNILANSSPEKHEVVPYRSSCLTHLLKESLGGNAKLSVICAISSDNKCVGETISTLRFGQRVKQVQNEPVINEISEDDVNDLSDQIRQLKDELMRAKSNVTNMDGSNPGYFRGRSVRESLNQLRLSLNRSLILPHIDNDPEEDVQINEANLKALQAQIDDNLRETSKNTASTGFFSAEFCETDQTCEHYMSFSDVSEDEGEISSEGVKTDVLGPVNVPIENETENISDKTVDQAPMSSLSICARPQSAILQGPMLSESPKFRNTRKSMTIPSNLMSTQDDLQKIHKSLELSQKPSDQVRSSLRSSRIFAGPTESLAASLHRGLEIIDYHQRNSSSNSSSISLSFDHLALKTSTSEAQTSPKAKQYVDAPAASFLCVNCKQRGIKATDEVEDSLKKWIIPVDEDINKDLSVSANREMKLEILCKEQAAKIEQLDQMLMQYKQELEHKASRECDKAPILDENQLLPWNASDNLLTEFVKEKCEIHAVQGDMDNNCKNKSFDIKERDELLEEIETLKRKLQFYTNASTYKSTDRLRSSLLSRSNQLRKSLAFAQGGLSAEELEKERERWTEMESEWISLTDELRIDIESQRQRAEKVEMELRLEKKVTEELDDVVKRSVLGHARMVEHYAELQEKFNELLAKHRSIMIGVVEIQKAAAKAGAKGHGSRYAKAMAKELSALRAEREREREFLKKENRSLKIQLRDTAEAVHAAGELLVRLREAEEASKLAEERFTDMQEENEKLKKQVEKQKRKHKMEMITMKQYLAESRLPEAALQQQPLYREDSDVSNNKMDSVHYDDDQAWRAEFGAIYQEHL